MTNSDGRCQSIATKVRAWIRQVLMMGLGLGALALTAGSLGNLSRMLNGALAVSGLLGLALLWPRGSERPPLWRQVLSLAIMAGCLPVVARGEPFGPLGAALFFFALGLQTSDPHHHATGVPRKEGAVTATALLLTALSFALYRILAAYVPAWWHVEHSLAIYSSWFAGVGLMLGPTALGLPLFVLFFLYASSTFLLTLISPPSLIDDVPVPHRSKGRRAALAFLAWLIGLALAVVAYLWLQPPLGSWLLTNWPAPATPSPTPAPLPTLTYLELQPLLFVLLWLVSALATLALQPHPLPLTTHPRSRRWVTVGLGLMALATIVLTLDPPFRPRRGVILFYDTGHLEWGRPVFGQYGPHSGGTFGLWPDYLVAYGYETRRGLLTDENLEGAQAVVLINLPQVLGDEEKDRLLAFVEQGGSLVIWGEHTGLGRIREPINDLLDSLPMRLRFDSAVPSRQGWAEGLTLLPHPAVYDVRDPVDLVIAVGASLQIEPLARPIIVGQFGHSDKGNVNNQTRNYVGDMRYNPGERLGDVVLAAEIQYGRGRIVMLGDTTPLGSVNLMTTMPFHIRLLDWVTAEQSRGWQFLLGNGWLAALLFVGAGACLGLGRSRVTLAGAALVMGLTLALTTRLNTMQSAPPVPTGPIAYVDISHQEQFDRLLWEETSIGGLNYNLVRSGALPLLLREIDTETLAGADLLVIIAPGGSFSSREVGTITRWVEGGGRLLVSVGWEESEPSQPLLAAFGLEVKNTPLGPAEAEGLVRFHEAWPVSTSHDNTQTIAEAYGYPLAVYQPWGEGGVVLIGDSAFLLGGTLESQDSYQEGNILLLKAILQEYLGLGGAP